jgi:hypothetical protein
MDADRELKLLRDIEALVMERHRLRQTVVEAARLLTLDQLQELSEPSAHVLADLGLLKLTSA